MKAILIGLGVVGGIIVGLVPAVHRPRPRWWMALCVGAMGLTIALGLLPPLSGTFRDAVITWRQVNPELYVPVAGTLDWDAAVASGDTLVVPMTDRAIPPTTAMVVIPPGFSVPKDASVVILAVQRWKNDQQFVVRGIVAADPILALPFIPGLEERARNLFFHVPLSWVAVIAYAYALWYAVLFLRRRRFIDDVHSVSAVSIGTLFALLATVTGSIWAKFNWGSFWNWDPRETSIFLLLLIYAAYFALRQSIEEPQRRAQIAAVYAIVAFVTVPFLVFIMPRLMEGLHPGSASDQTAGPILSTQPGVLHPLKQIVFAVSMFSFSLLFFWLLSLRVRSGILALRHKIQQVQEMSEIR